MGPTEAEGEPLAADASGHAVTGAEDPFASFLQTVQAMVQDGTADAVPATPPHGASRRDRRAARRAAKEAREHEQRLVREEQRSARTRRKRRRRTVEPDAVTPATVEAAPVAPRSTPTTPQRIPTQAAEPVLDEVADSRADEALEQGAATAGRRAGRRRRRQQAARTGTVPSVDPSTDPDAIFEPALDPAEAREEEPAEVVVEAGLAGIRFTAVDPVPVRRSRGARRLDRRREAARAVAASVPTAELVEPTAEPAADPVAGAPVPPIGGSDAPVAGGGPDPVPDGRSPRVPRRERKRARREARALAKADAAVGSVGPHDPPPAEEAVDPVVQTRRARRRLRREAKAEAKAQEKAQRAQATAEAKGQAEVARQEPGPGLTAPVALTRRARRRDRREERALAKKVAAAARLGESTDRRTETESLAEYVARVESPRLPRRSRRSRPRTPLWFRRTVKIAAVVIVVAGCATLPWVAPQVPDMIAGVLPGHGTTAVKVADPPIAPPNDAIVGPVGVGGMSGPYDGVRLQAAGAPREVVVKRLHVDSRVLPISGQSGSLLPPSDPQVLGWWKEGQPVGAEEGTAVITGHTVHTGGGALDHLDKLVVGDSVRVRTDAGWIRYLVQRTQIYSKDQLAREAAQVFRLGGSGRLVLITCDDWDGKVYRSNAVVFATPVLDEPSAS